MHRPAIWKIATAGVAMTCLSLLGAGTAVASYSDDVAGDRAVIINDVEAMSSTDDGSDTGDSDSAGDRIRLVG